MLHYAVVFFVIAIIAAVLGFGGIAGSAAGIAKILFVGFLILSVLSLIFGKKNYVLMLASVALVAIGFILMMGGGSEGGISFNPAIFSARRIVIAPAVCLIGFVLMIYAIMRQDKKKEDKSEETPRQ